VRSKRRSGSSKPREKSGRRAGRGRPAACARVLGERAPRLSAVVDLPTPPFWLVIANVVLARRHRSTRAVLEARKEAVLVRRTGTGSRAGVGD